MFEPLSNIQGSIYWSERFDLAWGISLIHVLEEYNVQWRGKAGKREEEKKKS